MNIFRKLRGGTKKTVNELYRMLYAYLAGARPVVFYNYTTEDYITKGYSGNSDVYAIINKIVDKAAVAQPYLYVDNERKKARYAYSEQGQARHKLITKALEFNDTSDLAELLQRPNESQTWREFIRLFRIFYFAQGEAFMYREAGDNQCATALYIAPAHLMTPVFGGDLDNPLKGWRLSLSTDTTRMLDVEDVLHVKMPNPNYDLMGSQLRGMSPLLSGLKYLQLDDKALEAWLKAVENEGAKGIVSPASSNPDAWLTEPQAKATREAIDKRIHGLNNKNKVVIANMPMQYTAIGLSPDALSVIQGLEHANQKLCTLWGLSPVLFEPNPTYQNQKEAARRFVVEVILPYLNAEEDKLNSWLVKPFRDRDGKHYVIDYDTTDYEELKLSIEDIDALLKIHTINEVRVMTGSDEIDAEYANEIFIQNGLTPLRDYETIV